MTQEKMKAGPVATGTDLRYSDLPINYSENNSNLREIQAIALSRRCAISFTAAVVVAGLHFGEVQ